MQDLVKFVGTQLVRVLNFYLSCPAGRDFLLLGSFKATLASFVSSASSPKYQVIQCSKKATYNTDVATPYNGVVPTAGNLRHRKLGC